MKLKSEQIYKIDSVIDTLEEIIKSKPSEDLIVALRQVQDLLKESIRNYSSSED